MMAAMKRWTDVPYEVVSGPEVRKDPLPYWFKAMMLVLATAFMLTSAVIGMQRLHGPTAPQSEADVTATPPAPDAR